MGPAIKYIKLSGPTLSRTVSPKGALRRSCISCIRSHFGWLKPFSSSSDARGHQVLYPVRHGLELELAAFEVRPREKVRKKCSNFSFESS